MVIDQAKAIVEAVLDGQTNVDCPTVQMVLRIICVLDCPCFNLFNVSINGLQFRLNPRQIQ